MNGGIEMQGEAAEPRIYLPAAAATAVGAAGKRLLLFQVPELDLMIKRVLASRPREYTYRWAYHPGHRLHVLLFGWPCGEGAGIAIPEGAGDAVLSFMLGVTDVYITTEPVAGPGGADLPPEAIDRIRYGNTVHLPDVKFKPEAGF